MHEQLTPFIQQRAHTLQRYISALESGDAETLVAVLGEAEQDQARERMILEINTVYQHEDHTVVQADDVTSAQQLLLKAILADQPLRRTEMQRNDNPLQTLTVLRTASAQTHNANGHTQKRPGVATPVFPVKMAAPQQWYRSRRHWITAAVAAALITLLLLPGTSALASQFLSLFQVQQFKAVPVTQQDVATLSNYAAPGMDDFGRVQFQANSFHMHPNLTQTQAAQSVNFSILLPSQLPTGVTNDPTFAVVDSSHGTFTFSAAKMHTYLVKNGHSNIQIPANLDGSTFEITTTAGVAIRYGNRTGNLFMVVELPSPLIQATGKATLQQLRDFILSLPGLPSQLVTQLKQIDLKSGTVPLLVPPGIDAKSITVHGTSGLLLSTSKTTTVENITHFPAGSMALWQMHGIIYALGGAVADTNQLLTTANSLQ